jgi:hypothetical protein
VDKNCLGQIAQQGSTRSHIAGQTFAAYSYAKVGVPIILFLRKVHVFSYALILILGNTSICSPNGFVDWEKKTSVMIANGDLTILFRDNSASPEILSGIQYLFNRKEASYFDAYDPDTKGASAGMNFEHIISGHKSPFNKFSPRQGKYDLFQLPDRNSVVLVRNRKDSPWDVSSTLFYKVIKPHYVDVEFRCKAHNARLFGKRQYAIFFFRELYE